MDEKLKINESLLEDNRTQSNRVSRAGERLRIDPETELSQNPLVLIRLVRIEAAFIDCIEMRALVPKDGFGGVIVTDF